MNTLSSFSFMEMELEGCFKSKAKVYYDTRGFFFESFRESHSKIIGSQPFIQQNFSYSNTNILRGLHYTIHKPQQQLVTCVSGTVYDVLVDLRADSSTFGRWESIKLGLDEEFQQVFMPHGIAHGFYVLSNDTMLHYNVTEEYTPGDEGGLIWNDEDIGILWNASNPLLSPRDKEFFTFKEIVDRDLLPKITK